VLDDSNFQEALAAHAPLLVEFYAPWCGHCKKLAPEYAKAAGILAKDGLKIAKVDATVAKDLATTYAIQGFPTLKFFPSAGGAPVEYNGGRETADIVKWVKGKSGPATTTVASAADLEKLADRELLALGFFAAGSEADKAFNAAALAADDATFAVVTDAAVRASFGVSGDAVVLVQRFAGAAEKRVPFEGAVTDSKALTAFVVANSLPLVIAFTQESAPKIFRGPVKTHFLLFVDSAADASPEVKAAFATTAEAFKGRALFVTVAPTEDRIVSYFGVTKEQMPTAVLVSMPEGEPMKKYSFDGKVLDVKSLTGFADSFFAGTLKPFLKSEEVPAGPDNGVTVVVGKNFKEVALDASKDVLLEFYAPWCGHCKQLAPEYEKLAARFAAVPHVTIAKMDATANEVDYEGVNVKGFPTLYFFPAGEAKKVVEYDGARDLGGLTAFLKKNVKTPFTLADSDDDEAGADDMHEL